MQRQFCPLNHTLLVFQVNKNKKKSKKAVLAGSGKAGKGPGMNEDYDNYGNDMDDFI